MSTKKNDHRKDSIQMTTIIKKYNFKPGLPQEFEIIDIKKLYKHSKGTLTTTQKQGIFLKYDKIHRVLGQGNFVLVVSEGHFGKDHNAFYDLFRVEDEKIAEHWDVIEKMTPKEDSKNSNGKF
jgi:hypothetical protein